MRALIVTSFSTPPLLGTGGARQGDVLQSFRPCIALANPDIRLLDGRAEIKIGQFLDLGDRCEKIIDPLDFIWILPIPTKPMMIAAARLFVREGISGADFIMCLL